MHVLMAVPKRSMRHVYLNRDWPALCSAGPAHIPLEHGAYARLSRPFLNFLVGGSGYETIRNF